ncbi:MAG: type II toxin-antitoxin system prevent-host-death family antitoxin [Thermomonas sp.]|uniref:type II toxin-antitoxin system prevent-host-death family antitoxin n=1 Tax=Thermomonas sp. TaxID=1971895 RepID=UPI0039E38D75
MSALPALKPLDALPQTPASDVKKLGWRGVMKVVNREGKIIVTNHGHPEAVLLSLEDYDEMLAAAEIGRAQRQAELETLRRQFDERLACLNEPGAGDKLMSIFDKPFSYEGKIFTGDEF